MVENFSDETIIWHHGVLTRQHDVNPNYPIIAWDGTGTKLLVIYWDAGQIHLFVYDVIARHAGNKQVIRGIDQVLDASYMKGDQELVMSAANQGQSDIYTYQIDANTLTRITNDLYDDLTPSFVSFSNRTGIIFASNRPSSNAPINDSILPSDYRYNIFMTDLENKAANKSITQLTDLKYGNAFSPMQYNANYFTFQSDENGITNRWAGSFFTERRGLDTVYYIGTQALQNPTSGQLTQTLAQANKNEPDSVRYFQAYKDSTHIFPITNYQNSMLETRQSGNNGQITEVIQEGGQLLVYKLKPDDKTLQRQNIKEAPSAYMKKIIATENQEKNDLIKEEEQAKQPKKDSVDNDAFQSEFSDDEPVDSAVVNMLQVKQLEKSSSYILNGLKEVNYHIKYNLTSAVASLDNNVLVDRYQPYANGYGPIQLSTGALNMNLQATITDLMEDHRLSAGVQMGTNFADKTIILSYQNFKRRFDWGLTYYRQNTVNYSGMFPEDDKVQVNLPGVFNALIPKNSLDNMFYTNMLQFNGSYPLDETRSLRATAGYRNDRLRLRPYFDIGGYPPIPVQSVLSSRDSILQTALIHLEYVYDNTISLAQNLRNGSRYKIYMDVNLPLTGTSGKMMYNFGFDARKYVKLYRNFIWAGRAAGDFSWGQQKIIYYLGGVDGWLMPRFNNANTPDPDNTYRYQSISGNMRGYTQNAANGNNAVVLNSEFRLPVFTTLFNSPINNAFIRNFQLIQFFDLGTAWNGQYSGIKRPQQTYINDANGIKVKIDEGGIGPFAAGYGFGARSTLFGYFLKLDCGWPMVGFFEGKPVWYFAFGLDF